MYQTLVISAIISFRFVNCYNFDVENVRQVYLENTGNYFGYSLLLQKGTPSLLVVGAPKAVSFNNKQTGTVYGCTILENDIKCLQYRTNNNAGIYYNGTGDFLGAALAGDHFVGGQLFTCAPRFITQDRFNYFLNGQCYYIRNTTDFTKVPHKFTPYRRVEQLKNYFGVTYYEHAFGEGGFDIKFNEDTEKFLIGLPGIRNWFGGLFQLNNSSSSPSILPETIIDLNLYSLYLGYSIAYGHFIKNSKEIWYVAGAPRASDLKGSVFLIEPVFNRYGMNVRKKLLGSELGSYYGSVVSVVNFDGVDSLLVSAPMYSGKSWDEGCVYFYKNKGNGEFEPAIELLGQQKVGGRFGTQISALGDIDLDSFNDIAISAPFEDDGVGAVYIYLGNENGLANSFSQRLTPRSFSIVLNRPVRHFGFGLSNGNDIDANGHNDLAIGAYKSDQVFVLKTRPVIDFELELYPNLTTLFLTTKQFSVFYCVKYNSRNGRVGELEITTELTLDSRAVNSVKVVKEATLTANASLCHSHLVQLQAQVGYIEPFAIQLQCSTKQNNFVSKTDNIIKTDIPFDHGCGDDNVCQVDLSLETTIVGNLFYVTPGLDREIEVNIIIKNAGEAAYHTELYLQIPENVEIINLRECKVNHGRNYSCIVSEGLLVSKIKIFHLDVRKIGLEVNELVLNVSVTSLGHDVNSNNNKLSLKIPVLVQNSPYIESKPVTDNLLYTDMTGKLKKQLEFSQEFAIGNLGPSPAILDIKILVPSFKQIFQIETEEDNLSNSVTYCNYVNSSSEVEWENLNVVINAPMNRTVVINCTENHLNCVAVNCPGIYLRKSSETVKIVLKITANVEAMVQNFKTELKNKNIIAFVSSALLSNGTSTVESSVVTLLHGPLPKKPVPFWVYIASGTAGIILLLLIIYGLYKCDFFNRQYKVRRLQEECLTEDNNETLEAGQDNEL